MKGYGSLVPMFCVYSAELLVRAVLQKIRPTGLIDLLMLHVHVGLIHAYTHASGSY